MQLLKFIGYVCEETVCVETDNKGAHDLCHREVGVDAPQGGSAH